MCVCATIPVSHLVPQEHSRSTPVVGGAKIPFNLRMADAVKRGRGPADGHHCLSRLPNQLPALQRRLLDDGQPIREQEETEVIALHFGIRMKMYYLYYI